MRKTSHILFFNSKPRPIVSNQYLIKKKMKNVISVKRIPYRTLKRVLVLYSEKK